MPASSPDSHARTHGIIDNTNRSAASHRLTTFPLLLQRAGYETAFVGKWHMGNDDSARPGFDMWVSFKGQGQYLNPEITEGERTAPVTGYITDILNDRALAFVRRPHSKPFLLYLSHKAVHPNIRQLDDGSVVPIDGEMFVPAERHRGLFVDTKVARRPNFGKPPTDKPALMRKIGDLPPLGTATATDDATVLGRQRALAAVDDGVGQIVKALEEQGQLANTLIVFAGDNGYFYGEHGLNDERRLAYQESARIPIVARFPKLIPARSSPEQLVLNIDIAPTVLEVAGIARPVEMEGRSLVPLFQQSRSPWRTSFVIEYFTDTVFPRVLTMGYQSVRTERWKYIRYRELQGMDELYDLGADPYELRNVIATPANKGQLQQLQAELDRLLTSSTSR